MYEWVIDPCHQNVPIARILLILSLSLSLSLSFFLTRSLARSICSFLVLHLVSRLDGTSIKTLK